MKIEVNISNPKSIRNAIDALKRAKVTLVDKVVEEMVFECCRAIQTRANANIAVADLGENVKNDIQKGWRIWKTRRGYTLSNEAEKAVYVEFGVGIVGEGKPHPDAITAGYEYDMPSDSKGVDGSWAFFTNKEDLDLPVSALDAHNWYRQTETDKRNRLLIFTRGTPATMFLHNAILDFVESSEPKSIWDGILIKYFG